MAEKAVLEDDLEKIKKLQKANGLDLSGTISLEEERIKRLNKSFEAEKDADDIVNNTKSEDEEPWTKPETLEEKNLKTLNAMEFKAATKPEKPKEASLTEKLEAITQQPDRTWETVEQNINKPEENPRGAANIENVSTRPSEKADRIWNKGKKRESNEPIIEKKVPFDEEKLFKRKPANEEPEELRNKITEENTSAKDVTMEAVSDFRNELKGVRKDKQWDEPYMQGMEDFIKSQREQTPTMETFKSMISFIRKTGESLNNGKISTKEAVSQFGKSSKEWAKKIFGEPGIGKSKVAKIDRLMQGDARSDEAIKIDETMGNAMEIGKNEAGEKKEKSDLEKELEKANSKKDFLKTLDDVGEVDGVHPKSRKLIINLAFKENDRNLLGALPEKFGIQKNAERIFDLAQLAKKESKKDEFKMAA